MSTADPSVLGAQGAVVVVAGATSASGQATVAALRAAGATAVAVGSDAGRLAAAFGTPAAAGSVPGPGSVSVSGSGPDPDHSTHDGGVPQFACDLTDFSAVAELASSLRKAYGRVDGVIHLVGGWRGGGTLADQGDEDWDFLARGAITTLRNTSRAFFEDIAGSPRGRFAMVSSTTLAKPTAANANYQAAKAAAEAWTRSMAQGLAARQSARPDAQGGPVRQTSAAVVLAVKALLDDGMRAASPERKFPGYTHVDDLAARAAALFGEDAATLNGSRLDLTV